MKFPATLRYCWLLARRYLCEKLSICLSLKLKSTKFKHSECKTFERRFSKITRFNAKRYIITRRNKRETGLILPRVLAQGIDTIKLQSLGHRQTIRMYKGRKFRAALIQSSRAARLWTYRNHCLWWLLRASLKPGIELHVRDYDVCVHIMHPPPCALWHNITLETRVEFSPVCKVSGGISSAVPHFFIFPGA